LFVTDEASGKRGIHDSAEFLLIAETGSTKIIAKKAAHWRVAFPRPIPRQDTFDEPINFILHETPFHMTDETDQRRNRAGTETDRPEGRRTHGHQPRGPEPRRITGTAPASSHTRPEGERRTTPTKPSGRGSGQDTADTRESKDKTDSNPRGYKRQITNYYNGIGRAGRSAEGAEAPEGPKGPRA
jgi:hypothetical protein